MKQLELETYRFARSLTEAKNAWNFNSIPHNSS
jgi:hypothetical protein